MSIKNSATYALVQLAKRHRGIVADALHELHLYVGQELLLLELWTTDALSQAQLADRLGIEQPTVAKAVKRMETAGLLRRERDARDSRIQRVLLTDRGRELLEPVEQRWAEADSHLLGPLTDEERRQLRSLIEKTLGG